MAKAAEEASLTSVGPNTAESAAHTDQHAELDQKNRSTNEYLTGVGRTMFPNGGVVGQQMVHPHTQKGPKIQNSLTSLDKQAGYLSDLATGVDDKDASSLWSVLPFGSTYVGAKRGARVGQTGEGVLRGVLGGTAGGVGAGLLGAATGNPGVTRLMEQAGNIMGTDYATRGLVDKALAEEALAAATKQANEEMAAEDLHEGDEHHGMHDEHGTHSFEDVEDMDPEQLERAIMFLQGLQHKGVHPGPEAQAAAAGLSQDGDKGMEVMAQVLDTMKTASHGEAMIGEILQIQEAHNKLASVGLLRAVNQVVKTAEEAAKKESFGERMKRLRSKEPKSSGGVEDHEEGHEEAMPKSVLKAMKEKEKSANLLRYLKAAAEGSLTDVGENTEESAAHTDSVAELDMHNRAPGAYLAGVGNTKMPNKGQVYAVEPAHQDSPVHTDNLPTNETKSAELAYVNNFRKIASELGPYLPATMDRDTKVAHLQTLMGMPPSERGGYLKALRAG